MKLYATVTSERASKGQGGNKYLNVDLMGGDKNNPTPLAHIHAVIITREDGVGYIKVCFYWETEDTLNTLHRVDIPLPIERKEKGKRQKGDVNTFIEMPEDAGQGGY